MKKTNKGFSMVELIIVIAIMAILAGALAPALIKYINKSRISTDIQTGNTIATAVQTALSNENAYDAACTTTYNQKWTTLTGGNGWTTGDAFIDAVKDTVGGNSMPKVKSKKCVATNGANYASGSANFAFYVDAQNNKVGVCIIEGSHLLYPTADECLTDDTTTCGAGAGSF